MGVASAKAVKTCAEAAGTASGPGRAGEAAGAAAACGSPRAGFSTGGAAGGAAPSWPSAGLLDAPVEEAARLRFKDFCSRRMKASTAASAFPARVMCACLVGDRQASLLSEIDRELSRMHPFTAEYYPSQKKMSRLDT